MRYAIECTKQYQEIVDKQNATDALQKAKEIESKRLKEGWRNIKIKPNLVVLVPCDKKGKPTKRGQQYIDMLLNR
jgi:hypothetical protein